MTMRFLRWCGGKVRVLPLYEPHFPVFTPGSDGPRFIDPMWGSGALGFEWASRWQGRVVLGDGNADLVQVYNWVKHCAGGVVEHLDELGDYLSWRHDNEDRKALYEEIRTQYNFTPTGVLKPSGQRVTCAREAAYFIFLNRLCFNGLHRENATGEFNVPYGKIERLPKDIPKRILAAGAWLKNQDIPLYSGDFSWVLHVARPGDLVYFDPPFDGTFDQYIARTFGADGQARLVGVVRQLIAAGVMVRVANSDTPLIRQLYSGLEIVELQTPRSVSCDGEGRGKVRELLIKG